MKLSQLSKEPQLIEVLIDDKDTVKEFGEALSFYTWDRQPMDTYVALGAIASEGEGKMNLGEMLKLMKSLVLDEDGKPIITDNNTLPMNVMTKVIQKVTESMGK